MVNMTILMEIALNCEEKCFNVLFHFQYKHTKIINKYLNILFAGVF